MKSTAIEPSGGSIDANFLCRRGGDRPENRDATGVEDFRWHDLWHIWASWLVQEGTPSLALQAMGGWGRSEMVRRYAHFSAEHLAPDADRLCALRLGAEGANGANLSQTGKTE